MSIETLCASIAERVRENARARDGELAVLQGELEAARKDLVGARDELDKIKTDHESLQLQLAETENVLESTTMESEIAFLSMSNLFVQKSEEVFKLESIIKIKDDALSEKKRPNKTVSKRE